MLKKFSLFICALVLMGVSQDAFATHFRFAHTTWKLISNNPDGSVTVEFNATEAWRADAVTPLGIDFGDGSTFLPVTWTDVLVGVPDVSGELYTIITYSTQHTYTADDIASNGGRFLAFQESCCRISSLINAGDASERIEILVDLNEDSSATPNTGSPVSTIPVIVQFAYGQVNTLQIAAADPDSDPIACRMASTAESQIPFIASFSGNNLTVDSNCLLSWDLSAATVANVGDKYAAQVVLEESNRCDGPVCGKVALDFIIEIVEGNPPVCTANVPVNNTAFAGVPFNATFTGTDADPGDLLTFTGIGAPAAAIFTPASGTSQAAPMVATLNWTPQEADKNTVHAILVTYQDQNGLQGTCSISIFVSADDPDPQCSEVDIQSSQFILDGNALAQLGLLKETLSKYKKAGGKKGAAKKLLAQGKDLYNLAWATTWSVPSVQFQCTFDTLCSSVSNASTLEAYLQSVSGLDALIKSAAKKLKKVDGSTNVKSIKKKSNKLVNLAVAETALIPTASDDCSGVLGS